VYLLKVSGEQCAEKWRSLLRRYREVKDRLQRSGSGGKFKVRFEHYTTIDDILGDKPSSSCLHVVSTMTAASTSSAAQIATDNSNTLPAASSDCCDTVAAATSSASMSGSTDTGKSVPKKKKRSADDFQAFLIEYLKDKKAKQEQREKERKEERTQLIKLENAKLDLLSKILKEQ